jgi:chromate transporter
MPLEHVFVAVLAASLLGFGGLGTLPVFRSQIEGYGVSHVDALLLPAVAVGNVSPGPNGLYIIAASYFLAGIPGTLVATLAVAIPPFLVLALDAARARLIHLDRFRGMLRSLGLGVVALLFVTDWSLVRNASTDPHRVVVLAAGAVMLLRRVPPVVGVAAAILAGLWW